MYIPGKAYEPFVFVRRPYLDRIYRMDMLINELATIPYKSVPI